MLFSSSEIRTALDAAVLSAWSPGFLAHSPPVTLQTAFPRAFLSCQQVPMQRGGAGDTTQRDVRQTWQFQIVGQFQWPQDVTTLYEEAEARAAELIALITPDIVRFAGWLYDVTSVAFAFEQEESYYQAQVNLSVYKIVGR